MAPIGGVGDPESSRMRYLDGWRGLAILLVLEGHFLSILPLNTGRLGVDVFFCLSGFLMSGLLFIKQQPLSIFYKRRISRVFPVFLFFVVSIYSVAEISGADFSSAEFFATLAFLRTYLPLEIGIWQGNVPIGHLWSLNVEEHAYLLMSLVTLLPWARGREGWVLLSSGTLCILIRLAYVRLGPLAPHSGDLGTEVAASHLFIAAGYRLVREHYRWTVSSWLPLLSTFAAACLYSDIAPWWAPRLLSPYLLAFAVNHLVDAHVAVRALLSSRLMTSFGIWSFSIYVWQQPFFVLRAEFIGGSAGAFVVAMGVALASYYFLEDPCRRWLNARWTQGRTAEGARSG